MKPFSEGSGHDVIEGFEMNTCVRERDMSCILTFCNGLADYNSTDTADEQVGFFLCPRL